jgi:hypothetical protein
VKENEVSFIKISICFYYFNLKCLKRGSNKMNRACLKVCVFVYVYFNQVLKFFKKCANKLWNNCQSLATQVCVTRKIEKKKYFCIFRKDGEKLSNNNLQGHKRHKGTLPYEMKLTCYQCYQYIKIRTLK